MKKFFAGIALGLTVCAAAYAFQTDTPSHGSLPTQIVVDNANVTIERNLLKPGEATEMLTHTRPHVTVVVQGSTIHIVNANGTATDKDRPAGFVAYDVPSGAKPNPHTVINTGKTTFEMITIELKGK
jgi:hypothetical protein